MMLVELFGKDKGGKYKVWAIGTTESGDLTIAHGQEGGKMTVKMEKIKPKNVGRANETTPEQQADLEALARIKKQLDKNYRHTKEELENLPVLAMLSKDHTKDGKESNVEDGVFTSDKLDGVRCLAKCKLSEALGIKVVTLESRTGQLYNVPHVQEELLGIMEVGDILDGELYFHGPTLQEITSAVKREDAEVKYEKALAAFAKHDEIADDKRGSDWADKWTELEGKLEDAANIANLRSNLQFHVFDIVLMDTPFQERLEILTDYTNSRFLNDVCSYVVAVSYQYVDNMEDLTTQLHDCIKRGYEGIMYRTKKGLYESGKRSAGLWKFKLFVDGEFVILDVEPKKDDGSAFLVQNDLNDETFSVTLGSMAQRAEFLANKQLYIGKLITVQYQSRYKDTLLPQFPTGKAIRDYE